MEHDAFARRLGLELTPEQVERLIALEDLLGRRGSALGLIADSDKDRLRERHIFDSLRCVPELPQVGPCLDLGSGGGLPGLVMAIARPDLEVRLVERSGRRGGFLEHAARELRLDNVRVQVIDVRELGAVEATAATARALAPLPRAWTLASKLLATGGRLIYFAGEAAEPAIPEGASGMEVKRTEALPEAGPLVIITR